MKSHTHTLMAVVILFVFCLTGCGPTIYKSPDFDTLSTNHRIAAILPFEVTIDPSKLPKDFSLDMKVEAEKEEAYNFQQEMYTQFLKKQEKNEYTIVFQDIDKTRAYLEKQGIHYDNLSSYTKDELKTILHVDVLLSGTIHRSKPMSTGAAIVVGALFGFWGSTNEVNVSFNIHDAASGELIWKYDHVASGSVGSSSEKLAESLMKNISKKFPYKVPQVY